MSPVKQSKPHFQTCRECHAWVGPHAMHCSMCGIVEPTARPWNLFGLNLSQMQVGGILGALGGALVGTAVGLSCRDFEAAATLLDFGRWLAPVSIGAFAGLMGWSMSRAAGAVRSALVGVVCGWLLVLPSAVYHPWKIGFAMGIGLLGLAGALGGRRLDQTLAQRDLRCIKTLREATEARVLRLRADMARMGLLRRDILAGVPPHQRDAALHALDAATEATERQLQREEVATWRLQLAQWQNPLQPIQAGWRQFTLAQCELYVRTLQDAEREGKNWQVHWQQSELAHTDAGRRVIRSLALLLGACDRLGDALLLRQAAVMAAGSPGVREAFGGMELPAEALRQIDLLRDGLDLTDMASGMAQLDEEALRLQMEQLAVREVELLVPERD